MISAEFRPWFILAGLTLGVTVTNGFARFAYGLILPAMRSEMGWSFAQAGWLNTANALGYLCGAILTMFAIQRTSQTKLFSIGIIMTTLSLLATGFETNLWWQTFWRISAGFFGAMSFSTAGALAAGLFPKNPYYSALAIAILFGSGGGLAIFLAGASLPLMIDIFGTSEWPFAWTLIGAVSLCFLPISLWSAKQLRVSSQNNKNSVSPPVLRLLPEIIGYACFGFGYIVYLTFLSAWMTQTKADASFITLVWVILGLCITFSPFLWRRIFARYASGVPLACVLVCIATGSALPVMLPSSFSLIVSAVIFGFSVFMAPSSITNFIHKNLPPESWATTISLFTVIFAVTQTIGPYGAGLLGDYFENIGISLLGASLVLLVGATFALFQKPL